MNDLLSKVFFIALLFTSSFAGWIETGDHEEYPQEMYFNGLGVSDKSEEKARALAQADLRKQITVKVQSRVKDYVESQQINGDETIFEASSSEMTAYSIGELEGAQVVRTEKKGSQFYALAVLDKSKFAKTMQGRIHVLNLSMMKRMDAAQSELSQGNISIVLSQLISIEEELREGDELRTLLSAVVAPGVEEQAPYTKADIDLLYVKCVKDIRMNAVSGDGQNIEVGESLNEPLAVQITAKSKPVSGMEVRLYAGKRKALMNAYTDDEGVAYFYLGERLDSEAGDHSLEVRPWMRVPSKYRKMLKAQEHEFSYSVESDLCECELDWTSKGPLSSKLKKSVEKKLEKYGLKVVDKAKGSLKAKLSYEKAGEVSGFSKSNSFIKTEVELTLEGEGLTVSKKGKGLGKGLDGSIVKAIKSLKMKKGVKKLRLKMCNAAEKPRATLAVFEFNNYGYQSYWHRVADGFNDMFVTELIKQSDVDVVERSGLKDLMKEKSLGTLGLVEEAEAMELAQFSGAQYLLLGSVRVVGGMVEIDARVVNVQTGKAVAAESVTGYSTRQLRRLSAELAKKLNLKKML